MAEPLGKRDADGQFTSQLPAGWWLVPAVLLGAAIWATLLISVVRLFL
jgi:hypothetical protein